MDKVILIGIIILIIIIGYIIKVCKLRKLQKNKNFIIEYNNILVEYLNKLVKNDFDNEKYNYLVGKSKKIQIEMGKNGVLALYSDPLNGFQATNYQFIVNFIPKSIEYLNSFDNIISRERFNQQAICAQNMFNRCINDYNEKVDNLKGELVNPFSCLAEAIKYILLFPINLLHWFGLISKITTMKISENILFKKLGFLIGLIGFISSVMGIILGWDEFIMLISPK